MMVAIMTRALLLLLVTVVPPAQDAGAADAQDGPIRIDAAPPLVGQVGAAVASDGWQERTSPSGWIWAELSIDEVFGSLHLRWAYAPRARSADDVLDPSPERGPLVAAGHDLQHGLQLHAAALYHPGVIVALGTDARGEEVIKTWEAWPPLADSTEGFPDIRIPAPTSGGPVVNHTVEQIGRPVSAARLWLSPSREPLRARSSIVATQADIGVEAEMPSRELLVFGSKGRLAAVCLDSGKCLRGDRDPFFSLQPGEGFDRLESWTEADCAVYALTGDGVAFLVIDEGLDATPEYNTRLSGWDPSDVRERAAELVAERPW